MGISLKDNYEIGAKDLIIRFLKETNGKYEIRRKMLRTINNGKIIYFSLNDCYSNLIVKSQ